MLDVPRELVTYVSWLLAAERQARGTRRNSRVLNCGKQALFVLAWFRKREDIPVLGAGFGISRATAYRYHDEAVRVLAAQAPDLHEALERAKEDGLAYVILDGKVYSAGVVYDGRTGHAYAIALLSIQPYTSEQAARDRLSVTAAAATAELVT